MPGFIEGHGHFTGIGEGKLNLELMNTKSWDEIVHMVAQAVEKAKPGQWIVGRGWHQEKWTSTPQPNVEGFPTHAVARQGLAEQSRHPDARERPRVVRQREGDGALEHHEGRRANPSGGEILKDKDGNPTGLLRETASRPRAHAAPASRRRRRRRPKRATRRSSSWPIRKSISKGITSFQDAGSCFEVVNRVKRLIDAGRMHVRLWMMIRGGTIRRRSPPIASSATATTC